LFKEGKSHEEHKKSPKKKREIGETSCSWRLITRINMLSVIIGMVAFAVFFSLLATAFVLKRNSSLKKKKAETSCSGGCSVCKHN